MTNTNSYIPTASEKKLLEVLLNPEFYSKSIAKICKEAGLSRTTYYEALKKAEFVDYYNDLLKTMIKGRASEVLKATFEYAIKCNKNHNDRRMLLTMAGMYIEKQEINLGNKEGETLVVSNMTLEQRQARIKELEKLMQEYDSKLS